MFRTASWYFGIHHILNFLEISMLAQDGWNYLNPIGTCGNVAQAGAVLAVAIKAASNKTKQVAYPACLSALLGITEPAVFGVNLKIYETVCNVNDRWWCWRISGINLPSKSNRNVNYRYTRNIAVS